MDLETTGDFLARRLDGERVGDHSLRPPFPKNCLVELSNACNHKCVFCTNPRMERQRGQLPLPVFETFVREAVGLGLAELGFYTTGDPFMTRDLAAYVQTATDAGVGYTYLTTNGALAGPERLEPVLAAGIKSLKFSINAATRESYALVHGADDFEQVLANVRWIAAERERRGLELKLLGSCVLTRQTESERDLHEATFGPLLDDIIYVNAGPQAGQSIAEAERVAPSAAPVAFPPEGSAEPCFMLWNRLHLTCEGYLTLCCVDYENNLTYASIADGRPLQAHWHNAIITEMRRRQLTQELGDTLCRRCLYGTGTVKPISSLRSSEAHAPAPSTLRGLRLRIATVSARPPEA